MPGVPCAGAWGAAGLEKRERVEVGFCASGVWLRREVKGRGCAWAVVPNADGLAAAPGCAFAEDVVKLEGCRGV